MTDFLRNSGRWLRAGALFGLVMFAAPGCLLDTHGYGTGTGTGECEKKDECKPDPECDPDQVECPPPCDPDVMECDPICDSVDCMPDPNYTPIFDPGPAPASNAIMCDFPKPVAAGANTCATQAEVDSGDYLSLSAGATALASGLSSKIALDWSPAAVADCQGLPKKVEYLAGTFPDGSALCLNCGAQIPAFYAVPVKACIAKCTDLVSLGNGPIPAGGAAAYCAANAKTSVNFDKNVCYDGACSPGGTPLPGFVDPRRAPEPVKWIDQIGVTDNGGTNTLQQTSPTEDFLNGAASAQTILYGDAWVEFAAAESDTGHVVSLRTSCADPINCPDVDPTLAAIGYGFNLAGNGNAYVQESPGAGQIGPFGPYTIGERYRVRATDNHDGTATISYSRVLGSCSPGTVCAEDVFYTSLTPAAYPLRVDASLRKPGASVVNVNLVRIQQ